MRKLATYLSFAVLCGAVLATACVDAGNKRDCVGIDCPTGLFWPDGGEVRIQYLLEPDGSELRYTTSFFIDDQDPVHMDLPPLGTCGPEPKGPLWEVPLRHYVDVGPSVTVDLEDDFSLTAPKFENATDLLGRTHDISYLAQTKEPTDPSFFNTRHSAHLSPETADQFDFSDMMTTMYMPPKVQALAPTLPEGVSVLAIKRHQDLEIEWQQTENPDPTVVTAGVIVFDSPSGTTSCVVPNTGHFVVPAEVIDSLPESGGVMQIGNGSNEAILTPEDRIIHMWASNCVLLPWTKVD